MSMSSATAAADDDSSSFSPFPSSPPSSSSLSQFPSSESGFGSLLPRERNTWILHPPLSSLSFLSSSAGILNRQIGHDPWIPSHLSMQSGWKRCLHGISLTSSPPLTSYSARQIAHSSPASGAGTRGSDSIEALVAGGGPSFHGTSRRSDSTSREPSTRVIDRDGWWTNTATSSGGESAAAAMPRIQGRRSAVAPRVLSSSSDGGGFEEDILIFEF